ncbi:hypothetical protein AVEN_134313-1 [Araneus ventricosus]|uniref:Uncharacterized protein n=1 Tax=Araneus ventricosus TaxID=182803 RepID=A0A4Y2WX91_ARAVE|nr:hypothetical protein AVEN_134313-1 [Araneus ventricosus]
MVDFQTLMRWCFCQVLWASHNATMLGGMGDEMPLDIIASKNCWISDPLAVRKRCRVISSSLKFVPYCQECRGNPPTDRTAVTQQGRQLSKDQKQARCELL